jgi:hypothetical protein
MATKTNNRIAHLGKEVELLRSLVIGILGRDKEGEYRSEFVERILRAVREKASHSFKDEKSLLKHLKTNS